MSVKEERGQNRTGGRGKKNKTRRRQVCGGRVKIGGIRIAKKTARGGEDEEREKRGGALITHTQKKHSFIFFFTREGLCKKFVSSDSLQ